jgi:tetratricopeptide (TPR) repeat protein
MKSKLNQYCDGLIESAWLAAVILVPLFFNIFSSRIFEPDKITLLRSLALLTLLAWIVKLIDQGGIQWDRLKPQNSARELFRKIPILIPVAGLGVIYVISTIFSVVPRTSLLGSYQRLQGTYTTFSYLVIFAAMIANLRKRTQVERLITLMILVSLPIALYGVLQKYQIDPVPWGGNTSRRIAANMGNSIFVAAFLIMVLPLALGRIVQSFGAILKAEEGLLAHVARATGYVFISALLLIAIYLSGSRGPALGLMAGLFFLALLLSLHWRKRWMTFSILGGALALGVFLLVFNIPNGPLEGLRQQPAIGRFGKLLDPESNTALVRQYIWEGAAKLVAPHEPLEYPDGSQDKFNILRPLIGYGPESMYVAYNPFYVPDLAHVEKRNASPDRSHNETWDSLVITGGIGLLAYLSLISLIFYYGLKWIGLLNDETQHKVFIASLLIGGLVGAIGFPLWRGIEYIGVGLPFGMLGGLLAYIAISALFFDYDPPANGEQELRNLTLIVLLAAIVAHFVEINFGIAIAATRTYFWVFTGLLVLLGYILPLYGEYQQEAYAEVRIISDTNGGSNSSRSKNSRRGRRGGRGREERGSIDLSLGGLRSILIPGLLSGLILGTLGYDFISNPKGITKPLELLWISLTRLPNRNFAVSFGILAMLLTTGIIMAVILASESSNQDDGSWLKRLAAIFGVSLVVGIIFWLWHSGALISITATAASDMQGILTQVNRYTGLLTNFYLYAFLLVFGLALFIPAEWPSQNWSPKYLGLIGAPVALALLFGLASYTNLRTIQADISFKLADPFTRPGQWPVAISIYDQANELAPNEDYYYLFLGRAYLEHARSLQDPSERDAVISQAEEDLLQARELNPLNTDHTANLARLYSLWASFSEDPGDRQIKAEVSDQYFSTAVTLSPNNARIWDEWGLLYLNILNQPQGALDRFQHALQIDSEYHWTHGLLGEYYTRMAQSLDNPSEKSQALMQADQHFEKALELPTPGEPQAKYGYALSLGGVRAQLGQLIPAIQAYQMAIEEAPNNKDIWRIEEAVASLYIQNGNMQKAFSHAQRALSLAPEGEKDRLQSLIAQLQQDQP